MSDVPAVLICSVHGLYRLFSIMIRASHFGSTRSSIPLLHGDRIGVAHVACFVRHWTKYATMTAADLAIGTTYEIKVPLHILGISGKPMPGCCGDTARVVRRSQQLQFPLTSNTYRYRCWKLDAFILSKTLITHSHWIYFMTHPRILQHIRNHWI